MWDNIGSKLQKLAKVVCWLGIIVSVISGIVFMTQNQIVIGLVYLILGSVMSWIGSWSIYGLGLVVEKVENGLIYTVEGNSGDVCAERRYTLGLAPVYGFGIPDY